MDGYRVSVRLKSRRVLQEYMRHRRLNTGYALAKEAGLKQGVVGHLVKGRRDSCSLSTALSIEDALDVPRGTLFLVSEYRVPEYGAQRVA